MNRIVSFLILFILFATRISFAQLSGTHTIGSGGDYATFNDAIAALTGGGGVNGALTFEVIDGTYDEQIVIPAISGASATNTITFQSQSGNAANVVLSHNASAAGDNYVVRLNTASYISFSNITFTAYGTTYAKIIEILNTSHHLTFDNCVLNGYAAATSSANQYLVTGNNTQNDNLLFNDCAFNEGSMGIYLPGLNGSNLSQSNIIQNSTFNSVGYYGIYLQYQNSPQITGNTMSSGTNGIYLNLCYNEIVVSSNLIECNSYSLNITSCTGGSDLETAPGLIANNMVYSSNNYGVYLYSCNYQNFYHNSINMTSGNSGTVGFYIYAGSNNNIVNNNFVHSGWGVAIQVYSANAVNTMDYNNYFSNGNYLAEWVNDGRYDLADFQASSGKDAHSISVYPNYTSTTDLHTMTPWLNGKGTPLSAVTEDYDGEARNGSTPDIGADEFTPDGATTTPLAGHYTVGGSSPAYATLADAMTDLLIKGVSDTVFLDLRNGNYNLQQRLYTVPGTAMDKPLVLQSESGNRDNVTLYHYATDANDNYILYLHGADHLHLRNLGFSGNTNTSAYSINLLLTGGVNDFNLVDCKLTGSVTTSTNAALVHGQSVLSRYRMISGNSFNNGGYGIYTSGINGTTGQNMNTMITDNQFNDQRNYALYTDYENSIVVTDNMVSNPSGNGIYVGSSHDEIQILRNQVYSANYGLYIYANTGGSDLETGPGLIANNFITSINNYAVDMYSCSYQNFYNNSVHLISGNTSTTAFYAYAGSHNNIINNIFVHSNGGYAYYMYSGSPIDASDYNDLYTTGANVGYWGGNQATLADFQAANGKDANSISVNPQFVSNVNLHVKAAAIDSAGTPLAEITSDIDGDLRDLTHPDIGADEFIYGLNYAPAITSVPDTSAWVDSLYSYQVTATDIDGDTLTYNLTTAPAFLDIDASSGLIQGAPATIDQGKHTVVVEVLDGKGGSDTQTYELNVQIAVGIELNITQIPTEFGIAQNYPNPFNPTTYIKYDLPQAVHVRLIIYNMLGQVVTRLVDQQQNAGSYIVPFNGVNLASGIYFYRIEAGKFSAAHKMILKK